MRPALRTTRRQFPATESQQRCGSCNAQPQSRSPRDASSSHRQRQTLVGHGISSIIPVTLASHVAARGGAYERDDDGPPVDPLLLFLLFLFLSFFLYLCASV
jgi:hypothetical protein